MDVNREPNPARVPLFHFVSMRPPSLLLSFLRSLLPLARPGPGYDPLGGCLVALAPLPSASLSSLLSCSLAPSPPLSPRRTDGGNGISGGGGSIIAIKWKTHKQPRRARASAGGCGSCDRRGDIAEREKEGKRAANETCGIKTTMRRKCYVARRANGRSFVRSFVRWGWFGDEREIDADSVG